MIAGAAVTAGVVVVNRTVDHELARIPRIAVDTAPSPAAGANYLVIGSDSRAFVETPEAATAFGDPSKETGRRSDTMMVVHVEPDAGRTLIVSFPRDLWVNIPGIGNNKINAAYNIDLGGGPNSIIEALKSNFDIDINHYIEVDFATFEGMVNSVGSVPVYVDRPAVDEFTGFLAVRPGCYWLNGTEALAWVRSRHMRFLNSQTGRLEEDGRADIGRIERQQDFIRRLTGTVVQASLDDPRTGRDIVHGVVDDLRVDRGFDKQAAFDLVRAFRSVSRDDTSVLEFATLPFTEGNAGGMAVLFPDKTNAAPMLERLRAFSTGAAAHAAPVTPGDVRVDVRNGSGREGIAAQIMAAAHVRRLRRCRHRQRRAWTSARDRDALRERRRGQGAARAPVRGPGCEARGRSRAPRSRRHRRARLRLRGAPVAERLGGVAPGRRPRHRPPVPRIRRRPSLTGATRRRCRRTPARGPTAAGPCVCCDRRAPTRADRRAVG